MEAHDAVRYDRRQRLRRFKDFRRAKHFESFEMSSVIARFLQNQPVFDRLGNDLIGEVVNNEICC
jgi:hypothetical protein